MKLQSVKIHCLDGVKIERLLYSDQVAKLVAFVTDGQYFESWASFADTSGGKTIIRVDMIIGIEVFGEVLQ